MAQIVINGVTTNISEGDGDGTIEFSAATPNLRNRVALAQGTFYLNATGVSPRPTIKATLMAATEFVSFDNATASVVKTGGSVTITGTSNSSKLTFSKGTSGSADFTIPSTYSVGGVSTTNGAAITNDPGASSKYVFSITLTDIPENTNAETISKALIVTANGSQTSSCTITVAAADASLTLNKTEIQIAQDGTVETVTVTANTSWTVSAS